MISFLALTTVSSYLLFLILYKLIKHFNFIDKPGNLKVHTSTRLTNIGLYFSLSIILLINFFFFFETNYPDYFDIIPRFYVLQTGIIILIILSFLDYKFNLNPILRLFLQFFVVFFSISSLPHQNFLVFGIFNNLFNEKINLFIIILLWIFIINLTNFIDGIDMLTSNYIITFSISLFLISLLINDTFLLSVAIGLVFCVVPFLYFNWYPAKVFFGDVGSVPLGFFVGWIVMICFYNDIFIILFISSLYFIMDILISDTLKLVRGENIFFRHNDFLFHKKLKLGLNPLQINIRIILLNIFLISIGYLSYITNFKISGILFSIIIVSLYYVYYYRKKT